MKTVRPGILFIVAGAVIGSLAGLLIERTSLIYFFIGQPATLLMPGETFQYKGPLQGVLVIVGGMLGSAIGWFLGKDHKGKEI